VGLFSFDRSHYESLRGLCEKTDKILIEYDKLDMDTAELVRTVRKMIIKAKSAMDRGDINPKNIFFK